MQTREQLQKEGKMQTREQLLFLIDETKMTYSGNDEVFKTWWYFLGCPRQKAEEWKTEEEYNKEKKKNV